MFIQQIFHCHIVGSSVFFNWPQAVCGYKKVAIFTTNVNAENQTLINHQCVCEALNCHFCQTAVSSSCFFFTKRICDSIASSFFIVQSGSLTFLTVLKRLRSLRVGLCQLIVWNRLLKQVECLCFPKHYKLNYFLVLWFPNLRILREGCIP